MLAPKGFVWDECVHFTHQWHLNLWNSCDKLTESWNEKVSDSTQCTTSSGGRSITRRHWYTQNHRHFVELRSLPTRPCQSHLWQLRWWHRLLPQGQVRSSQGQKHSRDRLPVREKNLMPPNGQDTYVAPTRGVPMNSSPLFDLLCCYGFTGWAIDSSASDPSHFGATHLSSLCAKTYGVQAHCKALAAYLHKRRLSWSIPVAFQLLSWKAMNFRASKFWPIDNHSPNQTWNLVGDFALTFRSWLLSLTISLKFSVSSLVAIWVWKCPRSIHSWTRHQGKFSPFWGAVSCFALLLIPNNHTSTTPRLPAAASTAQGHSAPPTRRLSSTGITSW